MKIVAVLPVCRPDFHQSIKWLRWARWLSEHEDAEQYPLVIFAAASVEETLLNRIRQVIEGWPHATLGINPEYYEHPELGYGACANQMFKQALFMMERDWPGHPMLWVEPDCIPVHPYWHRDISEEYAWGNRPFLGDFHAPGGIPHLTGNSVYPPNWRQLAPILATLPAVEQGWDSQAAHQVVPQSHKSSRIQQEWIVPAPKFTEKNINMVHPSTALWHRDKTGTLIDVLAARMGCPYIPLEPAVCAPSPIYPKTMHGPTTVGLVKKRSGVQILIVSCRRDVELLDYCLRSLKKYAQGFDGITLMVPVQDVKYFKNIPDCVTLTTFDEAPGKGFLHHMIQICRADEICPEADFVLHVDSDILFWKRFTPEDYVKNGKCLLVRERYEEIGKRNANRLIWRDAVEKAVGFVPEWEGMTRHCNIYPRALYGMVRNAVERNTGQGFDQYVFSCENGFPQSFAEFPTIASCGIQMMPEAFNFVNYDIDRDRRELGLSADIGFQYAYRSDRDFCCEGWTHGGMARHKIQWDEFLSGNIPKFYLK